MSKLPPLNLTPSRRSGARDKTRNRRRDFLARTAREDAERNMREHYIDAAGDAPPPVRIRW